MITQVYQEPSCISAELVAPKDNAMFGLEAAFQNDSTLFSHSTRDPSRT